MLKELQVEPEYILRMYKTAILKLFGLRTPLHFDPKELCVVVFFFSIDYIYHFFHVRNQSLERFKTEEYQVYISISHQNNDIITCRIAPGKSHCTFVKE